ncbi:MAG: alpha-xylosidase [Rikenellaceae bacterium]|nr:alpha-xylosidase [Rikenellaceae bacterium]
MKQTNYHLFDFLDFDTDLQRDEALWKAYKPTSVEAVEGDIHITVPFQKQLKAADMAADTQCEQVSHTLILRAYGEEIVRLFLSTCGQAPSDESEMLAYAPSVKKLPLTATFAEDVWQFHDANGQLRGELNLKEAVIDFWSDLQPAPQPTIDLTIYPDGHAEKPVRLSAYDHFSPPRYDALPLAYCETEGKVDRATLSFECKHDECFAGTGERFTKMDLSGHTFYLKNQDGQGVNNRRAYKNIPFYLSSRLYGVFYHTSRYCKLSLADHSTRSVQFLNEAPVVDAYLIGGSSPERILYNYRTLTGFPSLPPLWSFGIWMSRMTYFSADEVQEICDRLRREKYPCDVIHLDTGWFRTDWLCEWKFNPERFPDPVGFLKGLKEDGYRVSLWQLPYVAEGAEQITEAKENRYIAPLTKEQERAEGSNFSTLDYAGTIDFTYPKATAWYKGLLKELLDMGVVCIKTDFGENIHMDADYYAMSPEELNNLYALLYQKAAYEITKEVTGDGIVWARSAWAGCQRYPLHWGGDSASTWDGMAGSVKGGLHFGLSGFGFWSHDVPGFHSLPNFMNSPLDEKVYMRWTQFGVFTSHMRYHGSFKREPWHYPAIAPLVKRWWKLRYRLMPYIVEEARRSTETGYPMVRALLMHHPDDRQVWHIDDEYYFGSEFLVAPVMNSEDKRDVYLPEGQWVDFFTGERFEGGRWLKGVECPLERMPLYVKEGAEISLYPDLDPQHTDQMDLSKAEKLVIDATFNGLKF